MPRCYDCLSDDVTVKVTDPAGGERWFCAEDWAGWREFGEKFRKMLAGEEPDTLAHEFTDADRERLELPEMTP